MSMIFDRYLNDAKSYIKVARSHITALKTTPNEKQIGVAKKQLEEAQLTLQQLKSEANNMGSLKIEALGKIRDIEADINTLKRELTQIEDKFAHSSLLGTDSAEGRQRLINAQMDLARTTASLDQSMRLVTETEQIGDGIMTNLQSQREGIIRSSDRVGEVSSLANEARSILKGMSLNSLKGKIFLGVIILILVILIAVLVYFNFFYNK
ncbi:hypothetical protein WA158_008237 [Blastocystis sp. Blastoise]